MTCSLRWKIRRVFIDRREYRHADRNTCGRISIHEGRVGRVSGPEAKTLGGLSERQRAELAGRPGPHAAPGPSGDRLADVLDRAARRLHRGPAISVAV